MSNKEKALQLLKKLREQNHSIELKNGFVFVSPPPASEFILDIVNYRNELTKILEEKK